MQLCVNGFPVCRNGRHVYLQCFAFYAGFQPGLSKSINHRLDIRFRIFFYQRGHFSASRGSAYIVEHAVLPWTGRPGYRCILRRNFFFFFSFCLVFQAKPGQVQTGKVIYNKTGIQQFFFFRAKDN